MHGDSGQDMKSEALSLNFITKTYIKSIIYSLNFPSLYIETQSVYL